MVKDIGEVIIKLRKMYDSSEGATSFFNWAAERQKDATETTIDRLTQVADVGRREAIDFVRELEKIGCCNFIIGRRGGKSRVEWAYSLRSLGAAAKGQVNELQQVISISSIEEASEERESEIENNESTIRHVYRLRPNCAVNIELPEDFTKNEAERLSAFIQSLPFGA